MKYYVLARRKVKLISWDLTFISMLSAGTVTRKTDSGITSKKRQIDCF